MRSSLLRTTLVVALGLGLAACRGPKVDPCAAVGTQVTSLMKGDPKAGALGELFAERCRSERWSDAARTCIIGTSSLTDPKNCRQLLSADQAGKLDAALARLAQGDPLPAACTRYQDLVAKVQTCDQLPQDVRKQLADNLVAAQRRWAEMADKEMARPECTMAISSLTHAAPECPGLDAP